MKTIHNKRHKQLVEFIITKRKAAGIGQVQLGKRLKRSQTWVARLESGDRRIDVIELIDIAEAINDLIERYDLPAAKMDASAIVASLQQGKK